METERQVTIKKAQLAVGAILTFIGLVLAWEFFTVDIYYLGANKLGPSQFADFSFTFLFFLMFGLPILAYARVPTIRRYFAWVNIFSEPSGADIIGPDGSYWGQTAEGRPLERYYWLDSTGTQQTTNMFVAKMRTYRDTPYSFVAYFNYQSAEEAKANPQTVKVILQPFEM